ncbi:glycoside hydrolase family 16 protein [Phlebiopsis gigantea 11061_1 CR5-6]|uniref:Glycoside hydrolase family 16 protein n=1 Tax=Phlebiopsis gigantea (strain 11061_1 CR5-6) TaxID=745531 RepID=A0A0C3PVP3_PHLG1|nr:glycoside hydrolase family 16 protein [Phlebiopsis gigantea 11061_1 CR5-6]
MLERTLRFGSVAFFLLLNAPLGQASLLDKRASALQTANGSSFVWTLEDNYSGKSFFDTFDFFTGDDPTHYTTKDFAFANGLAYVQDDGIVVMKGDNTTQLASGVYRNRHAARNVVRISSQKQYNTGLFILDLNRAPWGCGVWPAWWTLGGGQWPYTGEIDIIEGVHDNEHNQVTWHTGPNCSLTETANFTGSIVTTNGQPNLVCDGNADGNAGCGVTEWSRASYGPTFDAQGGGVFAMKWDDTGISVWSFYRQAVPTDVVSGQPSPDSWGPPVAVLEPAGCDPIANFVNHSIVFDITFCGDWAGNSYATSGCPGTCPDRLIDPANFVNASWSINTLKVYSRVTLQPATNGALKIVVRDMFGWSSLLFGLSVLASGWISL